MPTTFSRSQFLLLYWLGVLSGLLFSWYYAQHQILTGDQLQMLHKGYQAAYLDNWIHFGNAASAVGNVPGSLSTVIIAVPLLLWDNPWAPMVLLIALRLAAFFLFDYLLRQALDQRTRLFAILLFWLNPWFLYESILYNPSYLCFASLLLAFCAYQSRKRASWLYSMLAVLSVAFAMQLHYSWILLALIPAYLWLRGLLRIHWGGVALGLLLAGLSLIPYLQLYLATPEAVSRDSERLIGWGLVNVYPVLKALLYWLRYGSLFFTHKLMYAAQFDWLTDIHWLQSTIRYSWYALLSVIGAISVVAAFLANRWCYLQLRRFGLWRKVDNRQPLANNDWLLLFCLAALVAVLIAAALAPIVFSYWHLIAVFPFALMPLLLWYQQADNRLRRSGYLAVLAVFFVAVNLVAANDSEKFDDDADYVDQVIEFTNDYQQKPTGQ